MRGRRIDWSGGVDMELRNSQITLGELWDDPAARGVFQKRVPVLSRHPVRGAARSVTLEQFMDFMDSWVPAAVLQGVMRELQRL